MFSGTRDTEMAVGCGDVHKFRMSLWAEHFRTTINEFI